MRFSKRLRAIYDLVRPGDRVADIGTDHGYVPLMLYENRVSEQVIMCDISAGSLDKAVQNFMDRGIDMDERDFRLGDGLNEIEKGEVDTVIIAGLGGSLIVGILNSDMAKTRSFGRYILQPRNNSGELRYFLYTNGFDITREILVGEGKFVCEVISASPSSEVGREALYPSDDIRWKYPEIFADCDRRMLEKRLRWKFGSIDEEIENLGNSRTDNSARIELLRKDKEYLETLLTAKA